MFIDIYAIQNLPPSNVNRDDTGSPKTAQYGGALRARVSSQAWKRAMRESFRAELDASRLGIRTKGAVSLIRNKIVSKRPDLEAVADDLAQAVLTATGVKVKKSDRAGADKGSTVTEYLIFIAHSEVKKLADIVIGWHDEEEDITKPDAAMKKEVDAAFHGSQALDIAFFGRMLADAPDLNTDASSQVAHAISVDQIEPEYDYFIAKDDLAAADNAGAAMLDTVGFNSSTLYRYATVNLSALHEQLQDDQATAEGSVAFVDAFIRSMPTGKQNTFANRTLPEACLVVLRESQPINAVDAFEKPVCKDDKVSIPRQAAIRLACKLSYIQSAYDEKPVKAWNVVADEPVAELDAISNQVDFSTLKKELREALTQAVTD